MEFCSEDDNVVLRHPKLNLIILHNSTNEEVLIRHIV
jgi:hypothetical protein